MIESNEGQYTVKEIATFRKITIRGARKLMIRLDSHPLLDFEEVNDGTPGRPTKCISQESWHAFERTSHSFS